MAGPAQLEAVIHCGGLGTRLQSVVSDRPKPMADIGGKPFLERLIDWAARQGVKRVVLSAGHKAEVIRAHFAKPRPGLEVVLSEEHTALGTAGALALAEPLLEGAPILVMNGDTFCDVSLPEFLKAHARAGREASIVAAALLGRTDGGVMKIGPDGRVLAFAEKAALEGGGWINAGILALSPSVLDLIPDGKPCSMEKEIFPLLLPRGIFAFKTDAVPHDIGTPERLEAFRRDWTAGRVPGLP